MVVANKETQKYFLQLQKQCTQIHDIAEQARQQGYDPSTTVEVSLAKNMAERVVGLISVMAPQIKNTKAAERIEELEKKYGLLDWRVALLIAKEVAEEKFCKFKDKKEAIEVGVRTGFAYITVGVVSSPLEGFVSIDIRKRLDGKGEYFCLNFSGPIRNAGGTAASICVIIADYLRVQFGYATYDPTPEEIKRCYTELEDYHEFIANLQYFPSTVEVDYMMQNLPVEISGDPSEKRVVSNYKDLPRIETNNLRSGYCLIHSSCIPLKAPKLWAQLKQWGKDFSLEHWNFLEEFLKIQKQEKAQKKKAQEEKLTPDYTYIKDLVAGRPVLGHPLRSGAFRLRYGRCRTSGYSSQSVHPATMHILNEFVAIGTQLKVERPGKAAAITGCDRVEGPIIKTINGSVIQITTLEQAKQHKSDVKEILYAGDILVCYGDFYDRAHVLVPPGYTPEFWIQEFLNACSNKIQSTDAKAIAEATKIPETTIHELITDPLKKSPTITEAIQLAKITNTPLHPKHTFHWKAITKTQLINLLTWVSRATIESDELGVKKIIIPCSPKYPDGKRAFEVIGLPHLCVNQEHVVIEREIAQAFLAHLPLQDVLTDATRLAGEANLAEDVFSFIQEKAIVLLRDKSGTFVGSRMARPEKAKMRKMTGSPHALFPVSAEGGKMRSFQSALQSGKITAEFPLRYCDACKKETVFNKCETCSALTEQRSRVYRNPYTKASSTLTYAKKAININEVFRKTLKMLNMTVYPDMIKGIKGTSNKEHVLEHLAKGILRAKHNITVNKDGTIRYDVSEIALTHFKPVEIGISVADVIRLGYTTDKNGIPITSETQVIEIKPQDIILPCCPDSPEEPADEVMFRTANFVDDLLVKMYHLKPFFKLKTKHDLIGHLIVGLAPHTSAGILGRIIGFSKTQGYFAHPLFHAAMRRDLDGDESCILLLADVFLNFSRKYLPESRGSTMDAPLVLTYVLNPTEVDDMIFKMDMATSYPLSFYHAALEFKMPFDVKIPQLKDVLDTDKQYVGWGYTHGTTNLNDGVLCSQYKLLVSMEEKLKAQMDVAKKLRAVDEDDVAQRVIEKHFIRDIKGNLRKFSNQQFRCVECNEKYHRPPLIGVCRKCGGKLLFTISQGSIVKYLEPTISLGKAYNLTPYLNQTIDLLKLRVESYFGRETEVQQGLGAWFG